MARPSPDLYRYSGLGAAYTATLAVFGFAGYWLDGKLGTSPWLLILGVFLGFGLGTYSLALKLPTRSKGSSDTKPAPHAPEDDR